MALFRAGVGLVLVLWLHGLGSLLVGALQDYWSDPSHLHCGAEAMEFSLPSVLQDAVFALMVIDKNGTPHYLHNDSTCGTWIGQTSDDSLLVGSAFDGCYVREENGNYVVTITLEEIRRDGKSQYHKKDLACPILLAMDAPSPSECTSVRQEERLQCANDSVSRELCEGLGCCFSQHDLVLRCYHGKKYKNVTPHYLHNNSTCGTWIGQTSDGSLLVGSAFDGCYVREKNGNYVVTITLEEILRDGKPQYQKKGLACPILLAKDAPSPSECTSVRQEERLQCANDSVSRELCEGLGCCFSQHDLVLRCYYGKKLTALCTDDGNMMVSISKDLTTPSLILDSVRVVDVDSNSCPGLRVARSASFIAYQFPLTCGVARQEADMPVVYENTFVATNLVTTGQMGSITRDSTMRVTVRCSYSHTDIVPLQVEVLTLPPPLPVSTSGPLLLEMRVAEDLQYNSYYMDQDYPIERVLRDPVHVEVRILQRTDPSLVLVLNDCWATNSRVPTASPQWLILTNSCPYIGDNYLTQLVPVGPSQGITFPTHYKRFIVSTFTFVDSSTQTGLNGLVFFHCSASVCVPSAVESCSVNCAQRQKRMVESRVPEDALTTVTSHGPIKFYSEENKMDAVVQEERRLGSGVALALLQGAAAAGLMLMVCLLGIYLYMYLSRRQKKCTVLTVNA